MKKRKRTKDGLKIWERSHRFNRHHILNKCRGGTWSPQNILVLDTERHSAWHFLFQNMSFQEVIELLQRTLKYQEQK